MISLETKTESASTSQAPIGVVAKDEEPKTSFSALLKGVTTATKDEKVIQNGAFIVSLGANDENMQELKTPTKKETLLSLLKQDKELNLDEKIIVKDTKEIKEVMELNPKVTQNLSVKEVKSLIADAKNYLKSQIVNSDEFKNAEIKELPKTLKGLTQVAQKLGIDISKISIEEVQAKVNPEINKTINVKQDNTKVTLSAKETKEVVIDTKVKEDIKVENKLDTKIVQTQKETKFTPLFKAQETKEHTTEQLVQTKQFKVDEKTPKDKSDETLKLLLRGERPNHSDSKLTADFSVATARVIAPSATTDATKSLEQLLRGEQKESSSSLNAKLDGLNIHKADSFEVKLNEAKQMIKYISQDVKTAIEDYKSPFTRVKVQLNPAKLGEVDVTIVQRGKNLHVSINSNNAAINTLSMNANELRTQLANNGINNASLNFNNNSQNSEQQASQQQQNRQNERKADEEYNYFDNEEQNEEVLSSLEIVVPNYA